MKLLLLGAGGQVGGRLAQSLQALGEVIPLDHGAIDLADAAALASAVQSSRADIVVNAAAYTAVDRAEDEPETAGRLSLRSLVNVLCFMGSGFVTVFVMRHLLGG